MAKTANPAPKVHQTIGTIQKTPLQSFIGQLNTPGMTPQQAKMAALQVHLNPPSGTVK